MKQTYTVMAPMQCLLVITNNKHKIATYFCEIPAQLTQKYYPKVVGIEPWRYVVSTNFNYIYYSTPTDLKYNDRQDQTINKASEITRPPPVVTFNYPPLY